MLGEVAGPLPACDMKGPEKEHALSIDHIPRLPVIYD